MSIITVVIRIFSRTHFLRHWDFMHPHPAPSNTDEGFLLSISARWNALGFLSSAFLSLSTKKVMTHKIKKQKVRPNESNSVRQALCMYLQSAKGWEKSGSQQCGIVCACRCYSKSNTRTTIRWAGIIYRRVQREKDVRLITRRHILRENKKYRNFQIFRMSWLRAEIYPRQPLFFFISGSTEIMVHSFLGGKFRLLIMTFRTPVNF